MVDQHSDMSICFHWTSLANITEGRQSLTFFFILSTLVELVIQQNVSVNYNTFFTTDA